MVSDFIQKHVTILRILIILTGITYYVTSTLHASAPAMPGLSLRQYGMAPADLISSGQIHTFVKPGKGKRRNIKVVIDAGHGGKDSGAVGKNSKEKDITLQLALKTGELMQQTYPEVEVLLTRTTDVFIPLFRRIQYANEQNADVFISVHCNFIDNPKTRGTETFVMGLHRAEDNLEVAKRENASILLEQNYEQNYEGYDPNSSEGHIMFSMYQNNYLDKSIALAANLESHFSALNLSKSRGVKQAGFAVLRRASMPAVLVEAGFLSNEVEENFLLSEDGQQSIASSMVSAFGKFYDENLREPLIAETARTSESKQANLKTPVEKIAAATGEKPTAAFAQTTSKEVAENKMPNPAPEKGDSDRIPMFKVQIAAIKQENADMDTEALRTIGTLSTKKQGEITKYMVGDYFTRGSAEIAREKLKNLGYTGAFIIITDSSSK
jgi:N-acetylmuramoyl-L-alanine amidase